MQSVPNQFFDYRVNFFNRVHPFFLKNISQSLALFLKRIFLSAIFFLNVLFFRAQTSGLLLNAVNEDIKVNEIRTHLQMSEEILFQLDEKIYFASNVPEQFSVKAQGKIEGGDQYRIFGIDANGDYKIQLGDQFFLPLKKGEGSFTFLKSRKELLITLQDEKFNRKNPIFKIAFFVSEYGMWKKKVFPLFDSAKFSCRDPYFSKELNRLYFSAKEKDSNSSYDLYECIFSDGQWSEPKNMGTLVNSERDELRPFTDADGILYFISDREGSKDIYVKDDRIVFRLKASILNSETDETGFYFDSKKQEGLVSRIRNDQSSIFKFSIPLEKCETSDSIEFETLCYEFDEETARGAAEDNTIGYEWDFGDGNKAKGTKVDHCFSKAGKYMIQLNVIDKVTGTIFYNQSEYELDVDYSSKLFYDFKKIELTSNVSTENEAYELSWVSRDSSDPCLKTCIVKDGKMESFITDAKMVLPKNFKSFELIHYLNSQKICCVVSEQSILNGIQKKADNMVSSPIIDRSPSKKEKREINEIFGEDPIKIRDADTKLNYKISLGQSEKFYPDLLEDYSIDKNLEMILDSGKMVSYYVGDYDKIKDAINPTRELFKKGLTTAEIVSFENGIPQKLSKTIKDKNLDNFILSDGFDLHFAFYYDKDVAVPRESEWRDFGNLMKSLKDTKLAFQINSYTDYTGSELHNEKLAKNRNKVVIDLLISDFKIDDSKIGRKTKNNSPRFAKKGEELDNQKLRRTDVYIKFVK